MYAFASAANNNGSAFAGLTRQHAVLQHRARRLVMLVGRFVPMRARARPGRIAGRASTRCRRPRARCPPHAAVRHAARRRGPHRHRPDLLPRRSRSGRSRRRCHDRVRPPTAPDPDAEVAAEPPPGRRRVPPGSSWAPPCRTRAQARPPAPVAQPGDVRRLRSASAAHHRRRRRRPPSVFTVAIAVWLWLTVLFANLAEAVAEGRGKAQADTLRRATRTDDRWPGGSTRRRRQERACPARS